MFLVFVNDYYNVFVYYYYNSCSSNDEVMTLSDFCKKNVLTTVEASYKGLVYALQSLFKHLNLSRSPFTHLIKNLITLLRETVSVSWTPQAGRILKKMAFINIAFYQ